MAVNPNYTRNTNAPLRVNELYNKIIAGDRAALSQAITLLEGTTEDQQRLAQDLLSLIPESPDSLRIGITGVPGVGKSTFIEAYGLSLIAAGHKVAVLAVDPTSSITQGSIMGDKTRMEQLVTHPDSFIRPSPAGKALGGVGLATRQAIQLCELAGYDRVLVETVGVGQSETLVHGMTDFFLLLKLPNAGDELQGVKRGIIEMADAIFINKADGDAAASARHAAQQFGAALRLFPTKETGWQPKVLMGSGLHNEGIDKVQEIIERVGIRFRESGMLQQRRRKQTLVHLNDQIVQIIYRHASSQPKLVDTIDRVKREVAAGTITPGQGLKQVSAALAR